MASTTPPLPGPVTTTPQLRRWVFWPAAVIVLGFVAFTLISPSTAEALFLGLQDGIVKNFSWYYVLIAAFFVGFSLFVGFSRFGDIKLGKDQDEPEFSTGSWFSLLFAAGMGIGLVFWGAAEPLTFFETPPPGTDEAETVEAMHTALTQVLYHWGPQAWSFYALIGGAIAYGAYRRGRTPLISSIFASLLGEGRTQGPLGKTIDIFAIIVTLFGTAASLGLGALQIGHGVELISGIGQAGNTLLVGVITVLTIAFIISAVSGVSRGIQALSNINTVVALLLALFVFFVGPSMLILNVIPSVAAQFVGDLPMMIGRSGSQGEEAQAFLSSWTIFYWAWWISWSPFVGMFIAKISRGRTLREFVTVVIIVPSIVSVIWFGIMGGATMFYDAQSGGQLFAAYSDPEGGGAQAVLYALFSALQSNLTIFGVQIPIAFVLNLVAMFSIIVFFVTSADSASIVMGSISQRGRPEPTTWVTIMWGILLGGSALVLLLAGGTDALNGLQSIMVVTALPFVIILIGVIISWAVELSTDPYMLRQKFAKAAIAQGVRRGIEEHGDDFVFDAAEVAPDEGAGANVDTDAPELTEWWDTATAQIDVVRAEVPSAVTAADVARTLEPGRIQPRSAADPRHSASGEASLTVGETRRTRREAQGSDSAAPPEPGGAEAEKPGEQ